jgi:hypothetical protein
MGIFICPKEAEGPSRCHCILRGDLKEKIILQDLWRGQQIRIPRVNVR